MSHMVPQSRPILLAYQGFYLRTAIVILFFWWTILLSLFAGSLKSSIFLVFWNRFLPGGSVSAPKTKILRQRNDFLPELKNWRKKVISCTGSRHLHIDVAGTGGLDVSPIQFCRGDRGTVHILVWSGSPTHLLLFQVRWGPCLILVSFPNPLADKSQAGTLSIHTHVYRRGGICPDGIKMDMTGLYITLQSWYWIGLKHGNRDTSELLMARAKSEVRIGLYYTMYTIYSVHTHCGLYWTGLLLVLLVRNVF